MKKRITWGQVRALVGRYLARQACSVLLRGVKLEAVYVRFDGPPGPDGPRFVEVENYTGMSRSGLDWRNEDDGYWTLGPFFIIDSQSLRR